MKLRLYKNILTFTVFVLVFTAGEIKVFPSEQNDNKSPQEKIHYQYPWKVHAAAKDFDLLDVWDFPIEADKTKGQDFQFFLQVFKQPPPKEEADLNSPRYMPAGLLVSLRVLLGNILGLDEDINSLPIPGCMETSIAERLSEEEKRLNLAVYDSHGEAQNNRSIWRTVYLYENEMLSEQSNKTVHVLMHFGWIQKTNNYYTAQLAVYVKPRGTLGRMYMKLIMPFRRIIVYPAMQEQIKNGWDAMIKSGIKKYTST